GIVRRLAGNHPANIALAEAFGAAFDGFRRRAIGDPVDRGPAETWHRPQDGTEPRALEHQADVDDGVLHAAELVAHDAVAAMLRHRLPHRAEFDQFGYRKQSEHQCFERNPLPEIERIEG